MERSLLITAPYFVNQIEVIRNIAKSLPINFKLFVKEHPLQYARGWRSSNKYNENYLRNGIIIIVKYFSLVFFYDSIYFLEIISSAELL